MEARCLSIRVSFGQCDNLSEVRVDDVYSKGSKFRFEKMILDCTLVLMMPGMEVLFID